MHHQTRCAIARWQQQKHVVLLCVWRPATKHQWRDFVLKISCSTAQSSCGSNGGLPNPVFSNQMRRRSTNRHRICNYSAHTTPGTRFSSGIVYSNVAINARSAIDRINMLLLHALHLYAHCGNNAALVCWVFFGYNK